MKPFFESAERQSLIARVAKSWIDTRFVPHARLRGAGVDCVHLAAEIYQECGVFPEYRFPAHTIDAGAHLDISQVLAWLEASSAFKRVMAPPAGKYIPGTPDWPIPGDLLCFNLARVEHHIGTMVNEAYMIHVFARRGVKYGAFQDPTYREHVTAIYRPVEL